MLMKTHGLVCLWPGLDNILITAPITASRGWKMGLAKRVSYTHLPGGWDLGQTSKTVWPGRKAEVLDLDMRTDAGLVKAADSTSLTAY